MVFKKGHTGYKNSGNWKKGHIPWNKGIKPSEETIQKISNSKILNWKNGKEKPNSGSYRKGNVSWSKLNADKMPRGDIHHNWKGGKSFEEYPKEFYLLRKFVLKRDKDRCKHCKMKSPILDIHHIDYNKKNNIMSNLITLCHSCHSKTNYNRQKWIQHMADLIK